MHSLTEAAEELPTGSRAMPRRGPADRATKRMATIDPVSTGEEIPGEYLDYERMEKSSSPVAIEN